MAVTEEVDDEELTPFRHVEPRIETLLDGFNPAVGIPQEAFIKRRMAALGTFEINILDAFEAREALLKSLAKEQGDEWKVGFQTKWATLTQEAPNRAAAYLANAACLTAKGVEQQYGVENLICAVGFGDRPETKHVKWPILPTMFPELSAWLLAPPQNRSQHLFRVMDCVGPGAEFNIDGIEAESLSIFWDEVETASFPNDSSIILTIHGKQVRAQTTMVASLRIYSCATFLSSLHTQLTNQTKCSCCLKEADQLKVCSRCHCTYYCGRECQTKHFPSHKRECKVVLSELLKRYSSDGIQTDILSLTMSLEGFLFPKIKAKWLKPLETYAAAEGKRLLETNRSGIGPIRTFRPNLT